MIASLKKVPITYYLCRKIVHVQNNAYNKKKIQMALLNMAFISLMKLKYVHVHFIPVFATKYISNKSIFNKNIRISSIYEGNKLQSDISNNEYFIPEYNAEGFCSKTNLKSHVHHISCFQIKTNTYIPYGLIKVLLPHSEILSTLSPKATNRSPLNLN